jgi:hypothetical protein
MVAILTGVRWNLSVVFICISFLVRDGEHFSMRFLAIWTSFLEKVLFREEFLIYSSKYLLNNKS